MIKFVYFDLGGVVMQDLSEDDKWAEFKREIGIPIEKDRDFEEWFNEKDKLLCIGKEDFDLIFDKIKLTINSFVRRFKKNESIWPIIDEIHTKARIGLLTNTYPGMLDEIKKSDLLPDVQWDVIIDSSIEGVQKPELKIYEIAQQKTHVSGNEILFIDNSLKNVEAARVYGWEVFLYQSSQPKNSSLELNKLCDTLFT